MSKVAIVKIDNYSPALLEEALRKGLKLLGGLKKIIKRGERVLLKVNCLSSAPPEQGVNTHPEVVRGVVKLVKEIGAIPIIGDSPASPLTPKEVLDKAGFKAVGREEGVEVVSFEEGGFKEFNLKSAQQLPSFYIARRALEVDKIISLPKLKTHLQTYLTGSVKNMFGVTPMRTRRQAHKLAQHKAFAEAIVDIFSAVRPCLGIMDAIIGMEGNGPSGGNLKKVSYLFLSEDCVALDAVAAKAVGFEKLDIWTTRVASQRRLGCGEIAKVKIVGDELLPVRFIPPTTLFMNPPSVISRTFYEVTAKKPHFDLNKCSRCRACLKHCPVNAITFEHYPKLHSARCIECFVCAEVCPEGAVNPQNKFLFFLTKLFRRLRTYCPTISRR